MSSSKSTAPAIEAVDLAKTYGDHVSVDGVSFTVSPGQILGYLGRNGSGKTTTVRMLTTLTRATSGSALVAGIDVMADPAAVREEIGVTMQDAALDPQMTAAEHLDFIAGMLGNDHRRAQARRDDMLEVFGLADVASKRIGTFSGGMQRRLDIATALLGDPKILFLDEPTTGLDPQSRRALWDEILRLRDRGTTIFLTTQYLEEADHLADHVAIIDGGAIVASGTAASLKAAHGRKHISFAAAQPAGSLDHMFDRIGGVAVAARNGRIHVEVDPGVNDAELVTAISGGLVDSAGALRDLEVRSATLEDVFLKLTGRAINQNTTARLDA